MDEKWTEYESLLLKIEKLFEFVSQLNFAGSDDDNDPNDDIVDNPEVLNDNAEMLEDEETPNDELNVLKSKDVNEKEIDVDHGQFRTNPGPLRVAIGKKRQSRERNGGPLTETPINCREIPDPQVEVFCETH